MTTTPSSATSGLNPASHGAVERFARSSIPSGQTLVVLRSEDVASDDDKAATGHPVRVDWRNFSLADLPNADGAVLDGCLAELLATSLERAVDIFAQLRSRYAYLVFDLCSWTEREDALGWRSSCEPAVTCDPGLRRALVGDAVCFKLGSVPANGGMRSVYKAYGKPIKPQGLVAEATFQRNHASWPNDKRLVERSEPVGDPGAWAQHVAFRRAISIDGDRYWIKTYTHAEGWRVAAIEEEIGHKARQALSRLSQLQPPRASMLDLVLPVRRDGASLLFPFDPDVFTAGPCHLQDWSHFLPPDVLRSVSILAATAVPFRNLQSVFLHNLCDFQVVHHGSGAALLDFEPNPWVVQLLGEAGMT
jgi:hypothetical protein